MKRIVTKEIIHTNISRIMESNTRTNLHNQLQAIEDLNRLCRILNGSNEYPCFELASNIDETWSLK